MSVVQLAAGVAAAHEGGCRAVLLDCLALLGPAANDETAAATADFLAWVFSVAVMVGFGVAGDVTREDFAASTLVGALARAGIESVETLVLNAGYTRDASSRRSRRRR